MKLSFQLVRSYIRLLDLNGLMKHFSTNGLLNRDRAETVYAEMVLQGLKHEEKKATDWRHPQQTDSSETCYLYFGFSQTETE